MFLSPATRSLPFFQLCRKGILDNPNVVWHFLRNKDENAIPLETLVPLVIQIEQRVKEEIGQYQPVDACVDAIRTQERLMKLESLIHDFKGRHEVQTVMRLIEMVKEKEHKLTVETRKFRIATSLDDLTLNSMTMIELIAHQVKLQKDLHRIQSKKMEIFNANMLCSICMTNKKNVLFDGCDHVAVCSKCLVRMAKQQCPICRCQYRHVREIIL